MKKVIMMLVLFVVFAMGADHVSTVKNVRIYTNQWSKNYVYFQLESMPQGLSYFRLHTSDALLSAELALLLNAKNTGSRIQIRYDDTPLSAGSIESIYVQFMTLI